MLSKLTISLLFIFAHKGENCEKAGEASEEGRKGRRKKRETEGLGQCRKTWRMEKTIAPAIGMESYFPKVTWTIKSLILTIS